MKKLFILLALCLAANVSAVRGQTGDPVVRFTTNLGNIDVQLAPADAPKTVANFLFYVDSGAYNSSFIHRAVPGFVIQGGGYQFTNGQAIAIPTNAPVVNEFKRSNVRGTIAMAKLGGDPNSATDQWFFNAVDNSSNLDYQNGGFTVFGTIINSDGLAAIDAIAALQIIDAGSPFEALPVFNYAAGVPLTADNFVGVQSVVRLRDSVQLAAASVTIAEDAGTAAFSVTRTAAGGTGAVSVQYVTADGTARAGVDYQGVTGTLSWAVGDTSPKTIRVPIINRGLGSGSLAFLVSLSQPGGNAVLGAPAQASVTILGTASQGGANIQAVNLLSPPTDLTVVQNQPISLYAEVEALANTLANVEFFAIDSAGASRDLGGFNSQRGQKFGGLLRRGTTCSRSWRRILMARPGRRATQSMS